jgi:hypothetical protein
VVLIKVNITVILFENLGWSLCPFIEIYSYFIYYIKEFC